MSTGFEEISQQSLSAGPVLSIGEIDEGVIACRSSPQAGGLVSLLGVCLMTMVLAGEIVHIGFSLRNYLLLSQVIDRLPQERWNSDGSVLVG